MPRELEHFVESAEKFIEGLDESERPCVLSFMSYCKNCGEFVSRSSIKNGLCSLCQYPAYRDIRGSDPAALENLRTIKENFKNWGFEGDDETPDFEEEDDDDDDGEDEGYEDQGDDAEKDDRFTRSHAQARAKAPPQPSKPEPDYWANMDRYLDLRFDGE